MFLNTVAFWLSIMALVSVLLKSLCITDETDRDVTLYTSKHSGVLALYNGTCFFFVEVVVHY